MCHRYCCDVDDPDEILCKCGHVLEAHGLVGGTKCGYGSATTEPCPCTEFEPVAKPVGTRVVG